MTARTRRLGAALIMVLAVATPSQAQRWEAEVRHVVIDQDPAPWVIETGEQIPAGMGAALRHVLPGGRFFVAGELSRGATKRLGAICGGFVMPGDCFPERVSYSGGLFAVTVGWLGRVHAGNSVTFGVRPRVGGGIVWASEAGSETGRTYAEQRLIGVTGVALEVGMRLPGLGSWLTASLGVDMLHPLTLECLDCRTIFWERLPQTTLGIGLRW